MSILFRIFLVVSVLGVLAMVMFPRKGLLIQRILGIAIALVTVIFVMFPDWTSVMANIFGVGRGLDFLFSIFNIFVLFVLARQHNKIMKLRNDLNDLIRELALSKPKEPKT